MAIWTGVEVEGPKRGECTIFVDSEIVDLNNLLSLLGDLEIKRIYFGAKESFRLPPNVRNVIDISLGWATSIRFVFETNSIEEILKIPKSIVGKLHIVFVFYTGRISAVKLIEPERNCLTWFELNNPIRNSLDDQLYSKDRKRG